MYGRERYGIAKYGNSAPRIFSVLVTLTLKRSISAFVTATLTLKRNISAFVTVTLTLKRNIASYVIRTLTLLRRIRLWMTIPTVSTIWTAGGNKPTTNWTDINKPQS